MERKVFSQAKWIWIHGENRSDEYAEFIFEFDGDLDRKYSFFITADSNYNVSLIGALIVFGQPTDYPHYKIYDKFIGCTNEKIFLSGTVLPFNIYKYNICICRTKKLGRHIGK